MATTFGYQGWSLYTGLTVLRFWSRNGKNKNNIFCNKHLNKNVEKKFLKKKNESSLDPNRRNARLDLGRFSRVRSREEHHQISGNQLLGKIILIC